MSRFDDDAGVDRGARRLSEVYLVVGPLYRRVLRAVEEDAELTGVSAGERAVLDLLRRHGPMTVPQMAREQDLTRQFVQRMVNQAAASGLVEHVPNPEHRRSTLLRLTDAGESAIEAVVAREHEQLRRACHGLDDDQVDATLVVLRHMLDAISLPGDAADGQGRRGNRVKSGGRPALNASRPSWASSVP